MEITKTEAVAVESLVNQVADEQVRNLNDLQLALVGGGIGDVIFG